MRKRLAEFEHTVREPNPEIQAVYDKIINETLNIKIEEYWPEIEKIKTHFIRGINSYADLRRKLNGACDNFCEDYWEYIQTIWAEYSDINQFDRTDNDYTDGDWKDYVDNQIYVIFAPKCDAIVQELNKNI